MTDHRPILSVGSSQQGFEVLFPFGPGLYAGSISDELEAILRRTGEAARSEGSDYRSNLAGNYRRGTSCALDLSVAEHSAMQDEVREHAGRYFSVLQQFQRLPEGIFTADFSLDHVVLRAVWINFQRPGDFNPAHGHSGMLSFVIYLSVPPEIFADQPPASSEVAGNITFSYGERLNFSANGINLRPQESQLFLFPAWLSHHVWPFFADVERVSVSGNIDHVPPAEAPSVG